MGKFSKAIEKAEKENSARPILRSPTERVRPDIETVTPEVKDKPVIRSDDHHRSPDLLQPSSEPVESSTNATTAVPLDPEPAVDPISATKEPLVENRPTHRLKKNSVDENTYFEMAPPELPVEPRSVIKTDPSPKPDGMNIALVKPEASEPSRPIEPFDPEPEDRLRNTKTARTDDTMSRKVVSVRYSKTKVQVNDLEKLKNNKIFSVFDEVETTEQIKILRTQILKKLKAIRGNSILITSANPYEGKTFTSINLGVSIAKEFDRTVLIIDADLRKPTKNHTAFATEFFSLNVEKGLTDYLLGDVEIPDILINPGIAKLTLIPGGKPVVNAPELLNSLRMEEMMADIKSRYSSDRLVIVDGPATLPFPDAVILSRYVDGVIPVVEIEKTSKEDLKKMMNRLKGAQVLGTVLNKNRE